MPSKHHGSPAKRNKPYRGMSPPRIRVAPIALPISNEKRQKQRDEQYIMVEKMRYGEGYFAIIQIIGIRLNIAKRLLETLFTDEACMTRTVDGLAALIQLKVRLDAGTTGHVQATTAEYDALRSALNVSDALEDTVQPHEYAEAARYVRNAMGTGADLVKR